jgi:hypothetical protein
VCDVSGITISLFCGCAVAAVPCSKLTRSARRGTNDNVLVVDGLKKTYNTGTLGCG